MRSRVDSTADRPTIQLRYKGARFDGGRLPANVLPDLPALRELVVAFAKERWRSTHTESERVPKGFDQSITLDLVAIDDGSAMPRLEWGRPDLNAGAWDHIVDEAFEDVIELVASGGEGIVRRPLSPTHTRALRKFGAGLIGEERVELTNGRHHDGSTVYVDRFRRNMLIESIRETRVDRYQSLAELVGCHASGRLDVSTRMLGTMRLEVSKSRIREEF